MVYNFDQKKFPVIWEVLQFVKSRTARQTTPRITRKECVFLIAKQLKTIWESAGCKTIEIKHIVHKYDRLNKYHARKLKQRSIFDIACPPQFRTESNFNKTFYEDQKGKRRQFCQTFAFSSNESQKEENAQLASDHIELEENYIELEQDFIEEEDDIELEEDYIELEQNSIELEEDYIELEQNSIELEEDYIELEQNSIELEEDVAELDEDFNELAENNILDDSDFEAVAETLQETHKFPKIYCLQSSDTSQSGFSNKTDKKIMETLIRLMAELDLSPKTAIKAVQIVANNLFNQCWHLPHELKNENEVEEDKHEFFPIDPYQLPSRQTVNEFFRLYALNSEKEVGKALLNNKENVLMCDGTTKQKVGKIITIPVQTNEKILLLPFHQVSNEKQSNLVNLLCYQLKRLEILTGSKKEILWNQIVCTMTDLASENHGIAMAVSEKLNIEHIPGQLFCVAHTTLGFAEGCKHVMQAIESNIGYEKIFSHFGSESSAHRSDKNYSAVWDCLQALLKLIGPEHSSKPYNRYHKFREFLAARNRENMAFAMKDHRFGRLFRCAAVLLYHWNDLTDFLELNDVRNALGCAAFNFTQQNFFKFFLLPLALVGLQIVEPYIKLVFDKSTTHKTLLNTLPALYDEILNDSISIDSVDQCKIPSLQDKFKKNAYPNEWICVMRSEILDMNEESRRLFQKVLLKFKVACGKKLSDQRGGAYGFGNPKNHLYPVQQQLPDNMLETAVIHNIHSENKFGEMDNRIKTNGPSTFHRVSSGLVIKQNKDLSYEDFDVKAMRKLKHEIAHFQEEFQDSQRSLVINELQMNGIDSLKISQHQKILKLREDLERKYNTFYPSTAEGLVSFIDKVNPKDKGKVLRSCVKVAKNDFKTLKPDHVLFKQQKLSNERLLANLMILYGGGHQSTGSATLEDIENALEKL